MSDSTHTKPTRIRINPSRKTCEEIIRRILLTENKESGSNRHFKTAMDFMTYFESLYPSSPALTKQVQRAIKSMRLAKDDNGYFLIDKTKEDLSLDREISIILEKTDASFQSLQDVETLFLKTDADSRSYLASLFAKSSHLNRLFITIIESMNGLVFLTKDVEALKSALVELGTKDAEIENIEEP